MNPRAMLAVAYVTGRASHGRQVKGDDPDEKGHPGPPGWGLGIWHKSLCVDDRLLCIPDSHLHRVTYTRCRIDTINSPDDGRIAVRNMQRIEINIHVKELYVKLVIYKDSNHG